MSDKNTLSKADRSSITILDAAYKLFTTQGYAATSMRQIAEEAGLALGSIYNHFESKEAIFKGVLQTRHPFFTILPAMKQARGDTVEEFFSNMARIMVAELGLHPEFLNLLLIELVEFKVRHAPLLYEKVFPEIMKIAANMQAFREDIRPIQPALLMRSFFGMFFAYFITGMLLKNLMPPEMKTNDLDGFLDIYLHGITLLEGQSAPGADSGAPDLINPEHP